MEDNGKSQHFYLLYIYLVAFFILLLLIVNDYDYDHDYYADDDCIIVVIIEHSHTPHTRLVTLQSPVLYIGKNINACAKDVAF